MTMAGDSTRHLATVWQDPDECWRWVALKIGRNARLGRVRLDRSRGADGRPLPLKHWRGWRWYLHLTPLHIEREANAVEVGVCLMDSHCEECGECRCDGADTGECAVALEDDQDDDDE